MTINYTLPTIANIVKTSAHFADEVVYDYISHVRLFRKTTTPRLYLKTDKRSNNQLLEWHESLIIKALKAHGIASSLRRRGGLVYISLDEYKE